ncbi:carbohydrate kinase family protein [Leucobacter sp. HY1908]
MAELVAEVAPAARGPFALVIGEALIDIAEHEASDAAPLEYVGGSPANVAMGLARLGHPALLATHLGADARGARIRDALTREGVQCSAGSFQAARTSTARAIIDAAGAARYEFDIDWRFDAATVVAEHGAVASSTLDYALVHTGSIALFLEPGGADVVHYLETLPGDVVVTLDPNVRPTLMPPHETALERFERTARRAQIVKLSDEDAEWLYPGLSPESAARQILALGADVVVVTLGAAGALAVTKTQRIEVPTAATRVVDTISAGDSFMAALISSALELGVAGLTSHLDAVMDRASRAAAIAVSQAGANPPHRAQLDAD